MCVVAAGCAVQDSIPPSVVVGVLSATIGAGAVANDDATRGAQLAIDVVNDNHTSLPIPLGPGIGLPGMHGARLTLVSADTKGQTDLATRQANEFVTVKHAAGVVLADSAEVAMTAASEMQRLRVPLLDATNTAEHLTEQGMDWYFRAAPGDRSMVEGAFSVLRRHDVTKIAVLTEPAGDSAAGLTHIQAAAIAAGVQIWHQQETSNITLDLANGEVQAIVAWAHTAEAAATARKMAAGVPGSPPIMGLGKGFRDLAQPPGAKPMTLRTVLWSADLAERNPAARAVAEMYERRFGHKMTGVGAATFTAVIALAVAVNAGGSQDPAAVRAALRRTSLPSTQMIMPWDGVRFASDGHNSLAASALEAWNGSTFRLVYPAELATERLRWPGAKQ
ncbi:MAG TPA: ABC transporter substrate-binding protein [Candidatus Limnocylindrales bacterium]|nr:ABC transporter substrate-binding protein [Candidatus Limnocylindrales bacterium]